MHVPSILRLVIVAHTAHSQPILWCMDHLKQSLLATNNAQGRVPYRIFGWGGETRWAIKALPPPRPGPSIVMYVYFKMRSLILREEPPVITFFTSVVVYTYTIVTHVLPLMKL